MVLPDFFMMGGSYSVSQLMGGKSNRRSTRRSPRRSTRRSAKKSPRRSTRRSVKRSPKKSTRRSVKRSPRRSTRRSAKRSPRRTSRRSTRRGTKRTAKRTARRGSRRVSRRGSRRVSRRGARRTAKRTGVVNKSGKLYCKTGCAGDAKRGTYKGNEPSPKGLGYCAHCTAIGKKLEGKDGNMWTVKKYSKGKRWVKN